MGLTFLEPGADWNDTSQQCPICGRGQPRSIRYPHYVCRSCLQEAVNASGRRIRYYLDPDDDSLQARDVLSGGESDERTCYIRGKRCSVAEARFGGLVVSLLPEPTP